MSYYEFTGDSRLYLGLDGHSIHAEWNEIDKILVPASNPSAVSSLDIAGEIDPFSSVGYREVFPTLATPDITDQVPGGLVPIGGGVCTTHLQLHNIPRSVLAITPPVYSTVSPSEIAGETGPLPHNLLPPSANLQTFQAPANTIQTRMHVLRIENKPRAPSRLANPGAIEFTVDGQLGVLLAQFLDDTRGEVDKIDDCPLECKSQKVRFCIRAQGYLPYGKHYNIRRISKKEPFCSRGKIISQVARLTWDWLQNQRTPGFIRIDGVVVTIHQLLLLKLVQVSKGTWDVELGYTLISQ